MNDQRDTCASETDSADSLDWPQPQAPHPRGLGGLPKIVLGLTCALAVTLIGQLGPPDHPWVAWASVALAHPWRSSLGLALLLQSC